MYYLDFLSILFRSRQNSATPLMSAICMGKGLGIARKMAREELDQLLSQAHVHWASLSPPHLDLAPGQGVGPPGKPLGMR